MYTIMNLTNKEICIFVILKNLNYEKFLNLYAKLIFIISI